MKSLLLVSMLIALSTLRYATAQNAIRIKSEYKCWIYADTSDVYSNRRGVIYSVADSGINFSPAIFSGNKFIKDERMLQYIPVSHISDIEFRKNGSVGWGVGIGGGVGLLIGGLIGLASGDDEQGWFRYSAQTKAIAGGIVLCIPGMLIGGLIGSSKIQIPINRKQNQYKRQKQEIRSYAIIQ